MLAPFEKFTEKDDNNSLVMLLESPQGRMLFTGDMELPQEASLLTKGDDLSCAVLKVPNHADDDTVSAAFADACSAQVAVISTSTEEKASTPAERVLRALAAWKTEVYQTQEAEWGILVTLRDGEILAERLDTLN